MAPAKGKQRFSREFLQTVLDGIQDPIRIVDRSYQVVFTNKAAVAAAHRPFDEILGNKCFNLFYNLKKPCPHCLTSWSFSTGKSGTTPFVKSGKGGETVYYEIYSFPIIDGGGQVTYVIELVKDVSARKKLEDQLLSSERLASMGEIAAAIAHEINNPIGIILGFAQDLLSESAPGTKSHTVLKIIEEEAERCGRVVRGLLDLAKPVAPQFTLVKVEDMVEKSLDLLNATMAKGKVKVVKRFAAVLPLVNADPQQLQQVFVNILLNAVEGMPQGGTVTLAVGVEEGRDGKNWVRVNIADTGVGISREDLPRVFLPFFSKGKKKGTGLGLSISKKIVDTLGGSIEMVSVPRKGTTCIMRFPSWSVGKNLPVAGADTPRHLSPSSGEPPAERMSGASRTR